MRMSISIKEISYFLNTNGIEYSIREDRNDILTSFEMENYYNVENEPFLNIVIQLDEKNSILKIFSPNCYRCLEKNKKTALFETLLNISWKNQLMRFEFDPRDGEVRASVQLAIEDSLLTERQFLRSLLELISTVDRNHHVIQKVLDTGETAVQKREPPVEKLLDSLLAKINDSGLPQAEEPSEDDDMWI